MAVGVAGTELEPPGMALQAAGMPAAVIGTAAAGMVGVECGMAALVTGTARAGTVEVGIGLIAVTVAVGELVPR